MEFNTEPATPDNSSTPSPATETIEQSDHSLGIDEYKTDSDTERDDKVDFEVESKTCMIRSGGAVRAFVRLGL